MENIKQEKFLQAQQRLLIIEKQYHEDIASLKQEVEELQNQLHSCCESR